MDAYMLELFSGMRKPGCCYTLSSGSVSVLLAACKT